MVWSLLCPSLCPRGSLYHLPPPYANQRDNKKPLVTIEDDKGPYVAVRLMSPLLYQLSYTARKNGTQPGGMVQECSKECLQLGSGSFGSICDFLSYKILLSPFTCWFCPIVPVNSAHDSSASFLL